MLKSAVARFFGGSRPGSASQPPSPDGLPARSAQYDPSDPALDGLFDAEDSGFVERCYVLLLRREADPSGLQSHVSALKSGMSKLEIATAIAFSEEGHLLSGLPRSAPEGDAGVYGIDDLVRHRRVVREKSWLPFADGNHGPRKSNNLFVSPRPLAGVEREDDPRAPVLWVDITTSMEWAHGVVGIVRAELELACGLKRLDDTVRFSTQIGEGFVEIEESELRWLLDADNVVEAYMEFFGRQPGSEPHLVTVWPPADSKFFHPYAAGDTIVSAGWMDSRKEEYFARVKAENKGVQLCYLIYDMILLLDQTSHFYPANGCEKFRRYVQWACAHCDFLLFGGETARRDLAFFQAREGWRTPPGKAIRFGTDIAKSVDAALAPELIAAMGVTGDFIITVGTIEPRKNHDTLYRAYLLALEMAPDGLPQLIICGRPLGQVADLVDTIDRDPRVQGKIIRIAPSDPQLVALYDNCLFTLLPSVYEGWSLTLPESLGKGKFCLAADTPPLREIGGDLVDYIDPFDVRSWAEKILFYAGDRNRLRERERAVRAGWPTTRWLDTARMVRDALENFREEALRTGKQVKPPTIWMDLTLTYLQWSGGVSGVIRTELALAYYLNRLAPETRFFAYFQDYYFEIAPKYLLWLFEATEVATAYESFQKYWSEHEKNGTGYRNPFHGMGPIDGHEAQIVRFPENSVLFFAGIDMNGSGKVQRTKDFHPGMLSKGVMTSQLLYDFTPMLLPQVHDYWTCVGYGPFVAHVSDHFDHLVYGGRTAQRDGQALQRRNGWKSPPSDFIEFGSDLTFATDGAAFSSTFQDEAQLAELGVTADFVMTVGTLEPRKNHEMLYKAFVHILQRGTIEKPLQLVFVGKPGWKTGDFRQILSEDKRVKGRILVLGPNDKQLHALYRRCLFTLLPSFYEGWSLTLPESLSFGKFCLASDVDPLRETGRDLVEYIHPLDTYRWAERMAHYVNNPSEVAKWEDKIRANWRPTTWRKSTARLIEILHGAHRAFSRREQTREVETS